MKIIHVCLACSYVEGWGYQENILPKMHRQMGYDVTVITSDYAFNNKFEPIKKDRREYVNSDGVNVFVLDRDNSYAGIRLKNYKGLYEQLQKEKPEIVFVHGGQSITLKDVLRYCSESNATLYIDQHGDYYNTPVNTIKKKIIHKIIFKYWMQKAVPYTSKFWGVTPWRCQYLHEVYGIPEEKIGLLVMGGDDDYIHFDELPELRINIRKQLDISNEDFVIITGGKIDRTKNIHLLIRAVQRLNNNKIKIIVFGQPSTDIEDEICNLSKHPAVRNIGWIESTRVYDYYLASDLAFFPGTHSVLWEQAAACGIPLVVKDWEGMHHLDVGGNCRFVQAESEDEYLNIIQEIVNDKDTYDQMKNIATSKAVKEFSYKEIAKRAIEEA